MCKLERWSVRTFRERIQSMLYERTAISKKPELTIKNDIELLKNEQKLSADMVFRDPYFLEFLGLSDKNEEHVELLQLENSNIKVAEYLTKLPELKVLEAKLHEAIALAKNRLETLNDVNE